MSTRIIGIVPGPAFARPPAPGHKLLVVEVPDDIAAQLQPGDVDLGAFAGSLLSDRGSWRIVVNRVRALLDLPALDTEGCSAEDGDAVVELVRCLARDSDQLPYVRAADKDARRTIDRLNEQAREDARELRRLREQVAKLESKLFNFLGGEP